MRDVLAVDIKTGIVRFLDTNKDQRNAEAVIKFAVYRLGVDEEFYVDVKAGSYKEGEKWEGEKTPAPPEARGGREMTWTCSRCHSEMKHDPDVEAYVCPFCERAVTEDGETVQRGA